MARSAARLLFACLLVILIETPAFPQADVASGTLRGTVTDPTVALVPGATVTVRDLERGITRTAASDGQGVYQVRLLQPGTHEVRVTASGFRTHVAEKIEVSVGQIVVLDVQLQVGALADEVLVSAAPPLVETERTQQSNTIGGRQIEHLPNIGRNFMAPVYSLPGVSNSNAPRNQFPGFTFGTSGFSIGGSNGRSNLVTVDGGEFEYGSGQLRSFLSPEAVQEYQVNRNAFAAEFGFTAGTAVNVVTRSGTNDFHGAGYIFYRSQKTSARDFFDLRPTKAFDQQMYPGVSFGGPLARNKVFVFSSYEALKSDTARFRNYTGDAEIMGPNAAQRAYLAELTGAADENIRRIGTVLAAGLNTRNFADTMRLLTSDEGTFTAPARVHTWVTRLDAQLGDKDALSARFSLFRSDSWTLGNSNLESASNSTDLFSRDYTILASWTRNFTANVFNQVRVQLVPNNSARTVARAHQAPTLVIPGVATFGRVFSAPFNTFQDRYQFENNLSWARGRHLFKFGASYRPVKYHVINELWFAGEWTFSSVFYGAGLALPAADQPALTAYNAARPAGRPPVPTLTALQSLNVGLPFLFRQGFNNPDWQDWAHFLGTFVQDTWKVNPRFTLDLGVRFDFDREPKPLGAYNNVSPRVGFAWDVFGDQKTVIRGGGGVFYSPVYYQVAYVTNLLNDSGRYINQIFRSAFGPTVLPTLWAGGRARGKLPFQSVSEQDLNAMGVPTGRGSIGRVLFDADPGYKNTYSGQISFGIQRQLVRDLSLEVAYQMYRGVHIQVPHERNFREAPGQIALDGGPRLVAIDPTIAQLNIYSSIGNSIYHGMTASLNKRYSRYTTFQINYTFSKTIDDVTDFNSAFAAYIPTRLNLERGVSAFDIRHNFVASGVFSSPFKAGRDHNILARAFADITLAPIVFLRSPIPFNVRIGSDTNGDNHGVYDRPFLAGRNTAKGENFSSVSLRLNKQFYVKRESGLRVEFITEAVNLFNHTNFLAVNDVFGLTNLNGPFGLRGDRSRSRTAPLGFTATAGSRQVQFGLRIAF